MNCDCAKVRELGFRTNGSIFRYLDRDLITGKLVGPSFDCRQDRIQSTFGVGVGVTAFGALRTFHVDCRPLLRELYDSGCLIEVYSTPRPGYPAIRKVKSLENDNRILKMKKSPGLAAGNS